ncbi:MAG TPA: aminopeptidase P N-terminal domain-containing protein, partial [Rhodocyclaceae bacterium]|nr:aminopeptidase P N-terminal domain-containing protein [Rhodocyclaceae bacterium]
MNAPEIMPSSLLDISQFAARRARLGQRLIAAGGGVAIIPTAPERPRNRDTEFPYRHDSYFYYLTGFREPESVLVLIAGDKVAGTPVNTVRSVLFCRAKHEEREIWDGFRYGPDGARETFGFNEAFSIEELNTKLPDLIGNQPALWYSLGHDSLWDNRIVEALNTVRANSRSGVRTPADVRDVRVHLDEMRLFKDANEIATMRQAAEISGR